MAKKLVLPRENLYRAISPMVPSTGQVRAVTTNGDGRTIELQWSVFDTWTEIDSWAEGNFMERIAPGSFTKTISENQANMRILLQHGQDPQVGQKPIASIESVSENDLGGYAEGRLLDGLDPLIVSGLRAGQYGSSFRFRVMVDEVVAEPEPGDHNPKGLPERTIREAAVSEFGPVTWGAYSQATAGVRSLTDEMQFAQLRAMPPERLAELTEFWTRTDSEDMGTLGQMIALAAEYIEEQDEPGEQANVTAMNGVLASLSTLMQGEVTETEPAEDEENASAPDGEGRSDAPEPEGRDAGPEPAAATPRDYLNTTKETPSWLLI